MDKRRIAFLAIASLALAFTLPQTAKSDPDPIDFQVSIDDPTSQMGGIPKSPVTPPSVSYDGHVLYFDTPCDGCVLNIVDSNDMVVYAVVIPSGASSLVLPAILSGVYELQIICGNLLFHGTITLR